MPNIPADEMLWLTYYINGEPAYFITSDRYRRQYYLYNSKGKTKHVAEEPDVLYQYIKEKKND